MSERLEKALGWGLSREVQQVLERTRSEGGFGAEQYRDIEAAIASSPYLHSYLNTAAKAGNLHRITLMRAFAGKLW